MEFGDFYEFRISTQALSGREFFLLFFPRCEKAFILGEEAADATMLRSLPGHIHEISVLSRIRIKHNMYWAFTRLYQSYPSALGLSVYPVVAVRRGREPPLSTGGNRARELTRCLRLRREAEPVRVHPGWLVLGLSP